MNMLKGWLSTLTIGVNMNKLETLLNDIAAIEHESVIAAESITEREFDCLAIYSTDQLASDLLEVLERHIEARKNHIAQADEKFDTDGYMIYE